MSLNDIISQIENDSRNYEYTKRNIPPILQVNSKAKVLIIGQAPGKKVEESLIPFNDKSGDTLISWMGIDRDTFYSDKIAILPMDFYYPGKGKTGDLPPRKFIANEYHESILNELKNIELTILIGKYSMDYYLKGQMKKILQKLSDVSTNICLDIFQLFIQVHWTSDGRQRIRGLFKMLFQC